MVFEQEIMDYLRDNFAQIHTSIGLVREDVKNIRIRMTSLDAEAGYVRLGLAEVNGRLDRIEDRMQHLERRSDILPATE